jgi:hypothetical protein
LQSVLQIGRLKRFDDDLDTEDLEPNFDYPIAKRQQGSRYVLPLGRLKRARIQPPNTKRQPKSVLQIGRLKRDEIVYPNDDPTMEDQPLDAEIKRLGVLPLGRLRKRAGFLCAARPSLCKKGSEGPRDYFDRIEKAHGPVKSILPIGRLKRMDNEGSQAF